MLDLPGHPTLDKVGLIGACSRLPVCIDATRLQAEVHALAESFWAGAGARVGVHRAAQAIFLRGFAPAEGEKPIEDRELLAALPYARAHLETDPGPCTSQPVGALAQLLRRPCISLVACIRDTK